MRDLIAGFLRDKSKGATPAEISDAIGLSYACVYSHLKAYRHFYVESDDRPTRWGFADAGTRRDWLAGQINESA